jgi:hypothetical protein
LSVKANLKLVYCNCIDIKDAEGDFIIVYNMPHVDYPRSSTTVGNLVEWDGKLVLFFRDIHGQHEIYTHLMHTLMSRAKLIITHDYEYFGGRWKEYTDKRCWLPIFFGPKERYEKLDGNLVNKKQKALVSGMVSPALYPLRHLAYTNTKYCDNIPHYGYEDGKGFVGDAYAIKLSEYVCCLTDCSIYGYLLAKHFEIPASGSLLLTNTCYDLQLAGFKKDEHYVEINEEIYLDVIEDVLNSPEKYQHIADKARQYVLIFLRTIQNIFYNI